MLTHLSIHNFTLVESLDLEINSGMTAITGETGAGKSIVLGALGQTLGDRTDADKVRKGAKKADISADFDISALPAAKRWLNENDLHCEDDSPNQCLLRRVITEEGRSRAYVNGQTVTLKQLKTLGDMLIDLHSQHEHQSLLKKETHRRLLDEFAGNQALAKTVRQNYQDWQTVHGKLLTLRDNADEISARQQLLSYQVQELDLLGLEEGEVAALEAEQKTLANAGSILADSHNVASLCNDEGMGLLASLNKAMTMLNNMPELTPQLREAEQLLTSAHIQVEEASREIDHHIDVFEIDPLKLQQAEDRLSTIYEIARKHKIKPEALNQLHEELSEELASISGGDASLEKLEEQSEALHQQYQAAALKLSGKRKKAASKLGRLVNAQLKALAMANAQISISLSALEQQAGPQGLEDIEFLISTNPGQSPKPLAKVASGGELSRVSLAIQVVTAKTSATPTLVFDEVDVGIGGATGDIVGQLLRELGNKGQVICVTHLAQVASKAHQHLQVSKTADKSSAQTTLLSLNGQEKIEEIARMLGGVEITPQSLDHAQAMLGAA